MVQQSTRRKSRSDPQSVWAAGSDANRLSLIAMSVRRFSPRLRQAAHHFSRKGLGVPVFQDVRLMSDWTFNTKRSRWKSMRHYRIRNRWCFGTMFLSRPNREFLSVRMAVGYGRQPTPHTNDYISGLKGRFRTVRIFDIAATIAAA